MRSKRDVAIMVRVTEDEAKRIDNLAKKDCRSRGGTLRYLALRQMRHLAYVQTAKSKGIESPYKPRHFAFDPEIAEAEAHKVVEEWEREHHETPSNSLVGVLVLDRLSRGTNDAKALRELRTVVNGTLAERRNTQLEEGFALENRMRDLDGPEANDG